jgi:hypothetical protein
MTKAILTLILQCRNANFVQIAEYYPKGPGLITLLGLTEQINRFCCACEHIYNSFGQVTDDNKKGTGFSARPFCILSSKLTCA